MDTKHKALESFYKMKEWVRLNEPENFDAFESTQSKHLKKGTYFKGKDKAKKWKKGCLLCEYLSCLNWNLS